ncbi:hypothetical protein ACKKBG_A36520 [Auxenochlorella protothecoides x Auxenochlorella symbiontica]
MVLALPLVFSCVRTSQSCRHGVQAFRSLRPFAATPASLASSKFSSVLNPQNARTPRIPVLRLRPGRSGLVRAAWGADVEFHPAKVTSNKEEALKQHRLVIEVGKLAAEYSTPGQFVQAKRRAEDKAGFFAIASPPDLDSGRLELLLKASGATAEELCALKPGEEVLVSKPMGKGFRIDTIPVEQYPSILLFATGSGISPIKALIESGALAGRRSVRLYYGTRTPEHMAFAQSIEAWSSEHGVTVLPVFSSSDDGYVQDAFARDENVDPNSSGGTAAVLCGQKEMTVELTALLKERGVDAILLNF